MIGWDHYIRGRVSLSWNHDIVHQLCDTRIPHITAEQWVAVLISINWKHIIALWLQRNLDNFGSTDSVRQAWRKIKMIQTIKNLQNSHRYSVPPSIKILIDASESTLEEMTEEQIADYLYSVKTLTKNYKEQQARSIQMYILHKDKQELDPGEP
jgi:hypothetical protein